MVLRYHLFVAQSNSNWKVSWSEISSWLAVTSTPVRQTGNETIEDSLLRISTRKKNTQTAENRSMRVSHNPKRQEGDFRGRFNPWVETFSLSLLVCSRSPFAKDVSPVFNDRIFPVARVYDSNSTIRSRKIYNKSFLPLFLIESRRRYGIKLYKLLFRKLFIHWSNVTLPQST